MLPSPSSKLPPVVTVVLRSARSSVRAAVFLVAALTCVHGCGPAGRCAGPADCPAGTYCDPDPNAKVCRRDCFVDSDCAEPGNRCDPRGRCVAPGTDPGTDGGVQRDASTVGPLQDAGEDAGDDSPEADCYLGACLEHVGDPPAVDEGVGTGTSVPCLLSPTGTFPPVQTQGWHGGAYDVAGTYITAMADGVVREGAGAYGTWGCYSSAICYGSEHCPCVLQRDGTRRIECAEGVTNPVYGGVNYAAGLPCYNEICSPSGACTDPTLACHNQVTMEFRGSDGRLYRQRALHIAELLAPAGSTVRAGARLARVGNTGFSCTASPTGTGNHGHVSVHQWDASARVWRAVRWWPWLEESCAEPPGPCAGLPDGAYCGDNGPTGYEGHASDLVQCRGGRVVSTQSCTAGCVRNPPGANDSCAAECPGGCSGHGACSGGECRCATGYAGAACDRCATGYSGYPNCVGCAPNWSCSWSSCASGSETASDCRDLNGCGTSEGRPSTRSCPVRVRVRRVFGSNHQGCGNPSADWHHCPSWDGVRCLVGQAAGLFYESDPGPDFWVFPLTGFGAGTPDTISWEYPLVRLDACFHAATTRHLLEPTDCLKAIGVEAAISGAAIGVSGWSCEMVGYVRTGSIVASDAYMVRIWRNESNALTTSFYQQTSGADPACGITAGIGWYAWSAP